MSSYPPNPVNTGFNFTKTLHNDTYPAIDSATQSDHTGHYVFITGASKGVGRATAISYAKAGAAGIAIGARSSLSSLCDEIAAAAQAAGKAVPKILPITLDVNNYASVEAAAQLTEKEFGELDILINNAGYLSEFVAIDEGDRDEWWMNFEVNIRGVYWMTKALLPLLLKGGEKTVVNLSSIGAHTIRYGASGYQTTKFALMRFTEHLMVEYGDKGLLAFGVHPGGVLTELGGKMPTAMHKVLTDKPEVAADTMCFLTAKRIDWLGGRYISCTWDVPELLSREDEIVKEDKLVFRMRF